MLNIIENFPILFDSKEKVKELRNLILSLAIQGKLVPQDPGDEPASVLLKRIEEEKKRLVKEKKIKKSESLPLISEDEIPFKLPKGWEWVRLGNLGETQTGTTPSTSNRLYYNGNIPFIKPADILPKGIDYHNESLTELGLSKGRLISKGSVIMVCIGGSTGKTFYTDRDCSCNQQINAITGYQGIEAKFIYYFISSPYFYNRLWENTTGTATPIVNKTKWQSIIIPLPPISEQHRIVQKTDELMALCDELEKALEKKAQSNELASKSICNLIQKSENQGQLKTNLTLLINMFKEVYSTKANIKDLRDTILQLAIQGKLVPQDPKDEPASVLLKQIEEEKEQLVKEKKIKKATSLPPISEEEKPFDLPKGWKWVRLGRIVHIVRGSSPRPKGLPIYFSQEPTNYNWITIWDITNKNKNNVLIGTKEYLTEEGSMKSRHMSLGEIIIAVSGSVGKSCILGIEGYIYDGLAGLKYISNDTLRDYLSVYLKSWESNLNNMSEGTSWPNINTDILNSLVIPLPPKEEQCRIVEKVDEFMALCDELEKHIEAIVQHSDNLRKAIIKTAN